MGGTISKSTSLYFVATKPKMLKSEVSYQMFFQQEFYEDIKLIALLWNQ